MITAIILAIFFALGDAGIMFINQKSFGRIPQGERLELVKKSPHYDGKQFVNELPTTNKIGKNSIVNNIWKFITSDRSSTKPSSDSAIATIKTDLRKLPADKDWIVWFGHSSYLLNLSGKKYLVDPVFYKASPVTFVIPMFKGTDVYKPSDMPDIDYLVITHDHWDHLDYETVTELEPHVKKVICGLGVGEHFEYWDYPKEKLIEKDWWDSVALDNATITYTPARHFSGRNMDQNKTLWASYIVKTPKRTIWIGGDSGYGPHFAKIGETFKDIDLAIMENGQYNSEDWPLIHTLPKYLATEMNELGAKRFLTVHHSKFALSTHDYKEPLDNAKKAAEATGKQVLMPKIGEVIYLE